MGTPKSSQRSDLVNLFAHPRSTVFKLARLALPAYFLVIHGFHNLRERFHSKVGRRGVLLKGSFVAILGIEMVVTGNPTSSTDLGSF